MICQSMETRTETQASLTLKTELLNSWLNCGPPGIASHKELESQPLMALQLLKLEGQPSSSVGVRWCFLITSEVGTRIRNIFAHAVRT